MKITGNYLPSNYWVKVIYQPTKENGELVNQINETIIFSFVVVVPILCCSGVIADYFSPYFVAF